MEAYALYQHQNLNKRGLSLKRMHDEGIFPVIDEYLRIRQVIPEDTNASVEQIVKTEVENSVEKLRGIVISMLVVLAMVISCFVLTHFEVPVFPQHPHGIPAYFDSHEPFQPAQPASPVGFPL